MPKVNPGRSIDSEANLADRIAYERRRRHLSYEGLAALMTDEGCAIQGSAIYKIEKGDPPRRVTVDELVALTRVFDVKTTDELLKSMKLIEEEEAEALLTELNEEFHAWPRLLFHTYTAYLRCIGLKIQRPDLAEFVDYQRRFFASRADLKVPQVTSDKRGTAQWERWMEEDFIQVVLPLALEFQMRLSKVAAKRARVYFGEADPEKVGADGQH
jgi:transcriptional regulator with XRE-family HTH domain